MVFLQIRQSKRTIIILPLKQLESEPTPTRLHKNISTHTGIIRKSRTNIPSQISRSSERFLISNIIIIIDPTPYGCFFLCRQILFTGWCHVRCRIKSSTGYRASRTSLRITSGHHIILLDRTIQCHIQFYFFR